MKKRNQIRILVISEIKKKFWNGLIIMGKIFNRSRYNQKRKDLRNNMPNAEVILWSQLKNKQFHNLKFRRQYGVGVYIIDFYCPKLKLAIELDGHSHYVEGVEEYDKQRQEYIESFGIHFLRFTNNDVYENLEGVLEEILNCVEL